MGVKQLIYMHTVITGTVTNDVFLLKKLEFINICCILYTLPPCKAFQTMTERIDEIIIY